MSDKKTKIVIKQSFPLGLAAIALSYYINKSILWALLHGIFGGFYIVYAILTGQVF